MSDQPAASSDSTQLAALIKRVEDYIAGLKRLEHQLQAQDRNLEKLQSTIADFGTELEKFRDQLMGMIGEDRVRLAVLEHNTRSYFGIAPTPPNCTACGRRLPLRCDRPDCPQAPGRS